MNNSCACQSPCPFFCLYWIWVGSAQCLLSFNSQNSPVLSYTLWQFLSSPVWAITQFPGNRKIFSISTPIWVLQYCTSAAFVSAFLLFTAPAEFPGTAVCLPWFPGMGKFPNAKTQIPDQIPWQLQGDAILCGSVWREEKLIISEIIQISHIGTCLI